VESGVRTSEWPQKEREKSIFFRILFEMFEMEFAAELRRLRRIRGCSHPRYDSIALASQKLRTVYIFTSLLSFFMHKLGGLEKSAVDTRAIQTKFELKIEPAQCRDVSRRLF
jgi:hypothetical protein